MNDGVIVATFVVLDEVLTAAGHRDHVLARVGDAEVLTVAVVAAAYFQNHHERAVQVMQGMRYLSGPLSVSRFNRRLHALAPWLEALLEVLSALFTTGAAFVVDSLPVPVCRRVRARRCRKVRGREFCGYCAAKRERFFGWRLHLVTTPGGVPVAFTLLPASLHDLTPVHELTVGLPAEAATYAGKAFNSAADEASILAEAGVRLVPIRRQNMAPNTWLDKLALREHRKRIETTNSQLEGMGVQRLRARTNPGFELKVHASLVALTIINALEQSRYNVSCTVGQSALRRPGRLVRPAQRQGASTARGTPCSVARFATGTGRPCNEPALLWPALRWCSTGQRLPVSRAS